MLQPSALDFAPRLAACLRRFVEQNGGDGASASLDEIAARLAALVLKRGIGTALPTGEVGTPGGLSEVEVGALTAETAAGMAHPIVLDGIRQLVKACLYPEFRTCRDSYREVSRDGTCRRQELSRARTRISGSHCVDCPYWTDLEPTTHAATLAAAWYSKSEDMAAAQTVFLPEDFRAVRQWLHAARRGGSSPGEPTAS